MKELSVEKKAKRYDEILARTTGAYLPYYTEDIMTKVREFVEYLLPELKESEDDGICRKLIAFLKQCKVVYGDGFKQFGLDIDDALAWLEKQGEHANFRNKIQIGDKVTRNEDGVLVNLSQLNRVAKKDEKQGEQKPTPIFRIGDTIIAKDGTYIEKEPFHIDMIEDDCYWDGENTILVCNQDKFEIFKQKSAEWSEDDQSNFNELGSFILETYRAEDASRLLIWFKSLKDRVQPQPKHEWSEEDEEIRNFVTNIFKDSQRNGVSETIMPEQFNKIFAWLESLKDRFTWKPSEAQIMALRWVLNNVPYNKYKEEISGLLDQIKEL